MMIFAILITGIAFAGIWSRTRKIGEELNAIEWILEQEELQDQE